MPAADVDVQFYYSDTVDLFQQIMRATREAKRLTLREISDHAIKGKMACVPTIFARRLGVEFETSNVIINVTIADISNSVQSVDTLEESMRSALWSQVSTPRLERPVDVALAAPVTMAAVCT
jgi:hypothetical protein